MLIALCGKPSVGKSTFFRAATLATAEIANYPFTTLKSSEAIAFVKIDCVDKDFNKQCNPRMGYCANNKRFVPVKLMDIPGLIEGSHKGLGRGNEFLADIAMADVLIHIVDISGSTNEKGESVQPLSYDPCNDIEFLENELDMWILNLIKKGWDKFVRQQVLVKEDLHKAVAKQLSGLGVTEDIAEEVLKNFNLDIKSWSENNLLQLARTIRKKTKPIIIAANKIDVAGADKNLENMRKRFPEYMVIPCSADSEVALREAARANLIKYVPGNNKFEIQGKINEKQKAALELIQKLLDKYNNTGVQDVLNKAVFDSLKYIVVYPGGLNNLVDSQGRILPDCFLMKQGSTALDFAFKLHTDFGKNFIRAIDVKKRLTVGKDHVLKHRDVIEIISGK